MSAVDLFEWNPRRPVRGGRLFRTLPVRRKLNNFGDLLGPHIVRRVLQLAAIDARAPVADAKLFSVGSVLHFAPPGSVVWGTGANGKVDPTRLPLAGLDVRAVRGPLTRTLLESKGVSCPPVFGDPALLLGILFPELKNVTKRHDITVVTNLNDRDVRHGFNTLNPRRSLSTCLRTIAASRLVVGSSLHGVIVAESLGIPAILIRSQAEPVFKYQDYFAGTGRDKLVSADSIPEAVALAGSTSPDWNPARLLHAFPFDLWRDGPEKGGTWVETIPHRL